jgi:transposase-like protein
MSDDYQRIELITGTARRRRWTTGQKLRIIEASCEPGKSVSSVARRHGGAPNLLYRWRRLMAQGGAAAVGSDEPVVGNSEVRRLAGGRRRVAPRGKPRGLRPRRPKRGKPLALRCRLNILDRACLERQDRGQRKKAPAETGAQMCFQRGNGDSLYPNMSPAKAEAARLSKPTAAASSRRTPTSRLRASARIHAPRDVSRRCGRWPTSTGAPAALSAP